MGKLKKVLLVDDEPEWLDLLERWLQGLGIAVWRAHNGLEALRLLTSQSFDLVITDTNMPEIDGVELLGFIRAASSKLPVIMFFSGLNEGNVSRKDLEKIGANAVLEKDQAKTQLNPLIQRILGAHTLSLLN